MDVSGDERIYYFEDLFWDHRKVTHLSDLLRLTDHLLDLQKAIRGWLDRVQGHEVLRYDGDFPRRFLDYAHDAFDRYVVVSGDQTVAEFLSTWDGVASTYLNHDPGAATDGVHGDFRSDNLFLHKRRRDAFKAVDWEYAGWGWIHQDLASLLKSAPTEVIEAALALIAQRDERFDLSEHRRRFNRALLERAILDAAVVLAYRLNTAARPWVNPDHFELARRAAAELR